MSDFEPETEELLMEDDQRSDAEAPTQQLSDADEDQPPMEDEEIDIPEDLEEKTSADVPMFNAFNQLKAAASDPSELPRPPQTAYFMFAAAQRQQAQADGRLSRLTRLQ